MSKRVRLLQQQHNSIMLTNRRDNKGFGNTEHSFWFFIIASCPKRGALTEMTKLEAALPFGTTGGIGMSLSEICVGTATGRAILAFAAVKQREQRDWNLWPSKVLLRMK